MHMKKIEQLVDHSEHKVNLNYENKILKPMFNP